jgi:hypothetical protein
MRFFQCFNRKKYLFSGQRYLLKKPKKPIGFLYEDKKTKKTYNGNGKVNDKDKVIVIVRRLILLCEKPVENYETTTTTFLHKFLLGKKYISDY